jgi:MFS family permease
LTGLWRQPDFLKLWSGQTISVFGSMVGGAALDFTAILFLQASPFQLASLAVARQLPAFFAGLVAGAWVDRLRRRPLLIGADLGRALLLGSIPLAAVLGALGLEQLYVVAFGVSLLTLLFDVAYQAHLPTLVRREHLVEGNSKLAASASVAEFGGFSLAGWLVQWLTAPLAVAVDALSFAVSAMAIGAIRTPEPVHTADRDVSDPASSIWREIGDGLTIVRRHSLLRALAGAPFVGELAGGMVGATIVLYMSRELGFSPGVLGMIWAVGGVTSFFGALIAGPVARAAGAGRAMVIALGVASLGTLLTPLAQGAGLLAAILLIGSQVVTDPASTVYQINEVSLRQSVVAERLQGRVSATLRFIGLGCTTAGALAGGLLAEAVGVRLSLFVGAGGGLLAALLLARSPVWSFRHVEATECPSVTEFDASGDRAATSADTGVASGPPPAAPPAASL